MIKTLSVKYECTLCGKQFTDLYNANIHEEIAHPQTGYWTTEKEKAKCKCNEVR